MKSIILMLFSALRKDKLLKTNYNYVHNAGKAGTKSH